MQEYVTELSRYGIAACAVIYTLVSFLILFQKKSYNGLYVVQNLLTLVIQMMCFLNLILISGEMQYVFFYVFVQVFLLASALMVPLIYEGVNRFLLNHMCLLSGVGLCILARLSFAKAVRQYIIILVSLTLSLLIPYLLFRIRFLKKLTWFYGAAGIVWLGIVLALGESTYGSRLTFAIGDVTFQPSEFVKILFVFFLAGALWEKNTFGRVALTAVVAGVHVMVLVLSKDLGSALIFFVGYVFLVFVATRNYLYLLAGAVGGSGAAYVAFRLFSHVQTRVLAWQDPWAYIDSKGYAITQSLFAIGSGSWFGMGLMKGNPTAIPFVEEDFIFSSICEELGVIFGICMILVMVSCFLMMMRMAAQIHDRFYQLIVYGSGIMYIFQIFLTVGGGIKLIPLTGVTLPLVSYGGSSVMATMFMFFIVQGVYIRLQQEGGRHVEKRKGSTKGRRNPGQKNGPKAAPDPRTGSGERPPVKARQQNRQKTGAPHRKEKG